MVPLVSAGRRA